MKTDFKVNSSSVSVNGNKKAESTWWLSFDGAAGWVMPSLVPEQSALPDGPCPCARADLVKPSVRVERGREQRPRTVQFSKDRILTTYVGSLPRPPDLVAFMATWARRAPGSGGRRCRR